jgi:hypothetical protein
LGKFVTTKEMTPMKKLLFIFCLLLFGATYAQDANINVLVDAIDYASGLVPADYDGDGDIDLLTRTLNSLSGNRVFLENTGNGAFARPVFFTHHDEKLPIALGDFDSDGDPDLAGGMTVGPNDGFFYRNFGLNEFITPAIPSDLVFNLVGLKAIDLDGDGDTDLLGWKNNRVFWAENLDGQGAFSGAVQLGDFLPATIQALDVADMNQDGRLDFVASTGATNEEHELLVVYQDAAGEWALVPGQTTPTGHTNDNSFLSLADLNGDGFPELVLYGLKNDGSFDHQVKIFANQAGEPVLQEVYASVEEIYDFALGDIDQDGDMDLALHYMQSAGWLRNDGNFSFQALSIPDTEILAGSVNLADLDGDGSLDLLQARSILSNDNGSFFVPNLGNGGSWGARQDIYYEITRPTAFAVIDWNSDGNQDVLWTDPGSGKLSWLEKLDGQDGFAPNEVLLELPGGGTSLQAIPQEQNNWDGLVLSISQDVAPTTFLLAVLNRNSAAPDDFQPLDIIDTLQRRELNIGDLDGDGDIDILAYQHELGLSWFEKTADGYTLHPLANADISISNSKKPGLGDIDGDGHPDAMGYVGEQLTWFLNPDGQGPSAQHSLLVPVSGFSTAEAADLNGDGRMEVVGPYFDFPSQNTYVTVVRYQPSSNTFGPLEFQQLVSSGNYNIMDVNNDGYPDYCSLDGTFLNLGSTGTFAPPVQPGLDLTVATPGDLDGDGIDEFVAARFSLYWVESTPFLRPALTGRVVLDTTGNCSYENSAPGIPNWLVRTENAAGEETIVSTQLDGRYALSLADTGTYKVEVVPPFSYWEMCPQDTTLLFPDVESQDSALFAARALSDCPLVTVSVYASRLRPCIPGFITVSYVNNGTLPAYDVPIEVVLDSALLVTGADMPWDIMTDSSLIFTIPELGLFESGRIVLNVEPDCNLVEVGDLICTTVQTEPDTSCLPPEGLWDGSTLEANGYCLGDTTYFELRNVGDSPMSEARSYRIEIVNDDIVVFLIDDIQLNPGELLPINIPYDSLALRLVAEQDPNHPLADDVSLVVAGCEFPDSLLAGVVDQFPYSTGNPFRQTFCREVTSSFDPNIKTALPRGIGEDHLIDDDWRLNYVIDFQNTGNDTAFTVVVRDTLSEHLDLSSLRIQGGSDPFSWALQSRP